MARQPAARVPERQAALRDMHSTDRRWGNLAGEGTLSPAGEVGSGGPVRIERYEMREWQNRPLNPVYPVVFFDTLRAKIRDEG